MILHGQAGTRICARTSCSLSHDGIYTAQTLVYLWIWKAVVFMNYPTLVQLALHAFFLVIKANKTSSFQFMSEQPYMLISSAFDLKLN